MDRNGGGSKATAFAPARSNPNRCGTGSTSGSAALPDDKLLSAINAALPKVKNRASAVCGMSGFRFRIHCQRPSVGCPMRPVFPKSCLPRMGLLLRRRRSCLFPYPLAGQIPAPAQGKFSEEGGRPLSRGALPSRSFPSSPPIFAGGAR